LRGLVWPDGYRRDDLSFVVLEKPVALEESLVLEKASPLESSL